MIKGKKKDAKKKDAKKDGKKAAVEKSEDSLGTTAESSLTTLPDLQNESLSEEAQAIPEAPDKEPRVEEPPVQPLPPIHEEPVLAQVIVKSYEGVQIDEFYEGEGFICFEGGNTYKGLFSEGRMNGEGTYTWADGVKYQGTFTKNVPMRSGRYIWNDGSVYEGSIQDGLRHGYGVFRSSTHPISYIGDWCNGKRHGKGKIYYNQEQTSWYSGDWVNNVREGWGFRRYRSGNTYEGQWKKNLRHGHGKMKWLTDNQEYVGQWECGVQHGSGVHTWILKRMEMSRYPLQNEYVGDFVKGERHGHGVFIYADGAVYSGEWVHNEKHGKGRFILANGEAFDGEFVNDRPVECPAHQGTAVEAKNLGATSPRRRSGTKRTTVLSALGKISILGSDIGLDISSLLFLLPEKDREKEKQQVELAVLRHISKLRKAYYFYSTLGCAPAPGGTYILNKLQFWRFLKDCNFHLSLTLAEMDRLLRGQIPLQDIHSPCEVILFRTFVSYLVYLAFHIYHENYNRDRVPCLKNCFLEMMSRNVLPFACRVQSILYSGKEFTSFAMSYYDKCWEIYRDFCRPCPTPPFEPTVKLRQFLWMLDDFKLISEQLTAPRVLGIFVKVGASVPGIRGINLELEMVFLEFFEALLECALVYVTEEMILKKEAQDNQKRSSFEIKEFSKETSAVSFMEHSPPQPPGPGEDTKPAQPSLLETLLSFSVTPGESKDDVSLPSKDVKEEQDSCPEKELADEAEEDKDEQKELFRLWMCQVEIFFTTNFFPAFEHEIVLRDKIKEEKKQDAELAELRKIQAEELERLIAEKEAEAAEKQKAAAAAAVSQGRVKARKRALSCWEKLLTWKGVLVWKGTKKEAPKKEPSPKKRGSR